MTMNINPYDIDVAVQAYLDTNWAYKTVCPIREINKDDATVPYIECYTKPGRMFAIEINGAKERPGVFIINVFTQKGVGTQQGYSYCGKLEDLFLNKTIGDGVVCSNGDLEPYSEYIGIDDALQACHHKTTIPFHVITEIS